MKIALTINGFFLDFDVPASEVWFTFFSIAIFVTFVTLSFGTVSITRPGAFTFLLLFASITSIPITSVHVLTRTTSSLLTITRATTSIPFSFPNSWRSWTTIKSFGTITEIWATIFALTLQTISLSFALIIFAPRMLDIHIGTAASCATQTTTCDTIWKTYGLIFAVPIELNGFEFRCLPKRRGSHPFTVRALSTSTNTRLPSIFLPSACLYAAIKINWKRK